MQDIWSETRDDETDHDYETDHDRRHRSPSGFDGLGLHRKRAHQLRIQHEVYSTSEPYLLLSARDEDDEDDYIATISRQFDIEDDEGDDDED